MVCEIIRKMSDSVGNIKQDWKSVNLSRETWWSKLKSFAKLINEGINGQNWIVGPDWKMNKVEKWIKVNIEQFFKMDKIEWKVGKKYQTETVFQNSTKFNHGQTNGERRTQ